MLLTGGAGGGGGGGVFTGVVRGSLGLESTIGTGTEVCRWGGKRERRRKRRKKKLTKKGAGALETGRIDRKRQTHKYKTDAHTKESIPQVSKSIGSDTALRTTAVTKQKMRNGVDLSSQ